MLHMLDSGRLQLGGAAQKCASIWDNLPSAGASGYSWLGSRRLPLDRTGLAMIPRREFLRTSAVSAGSLLTACAVDSVPKGRTPVSLWFSYGGTNREVLESLVQALQ